MSWLADLVLVLHFAFVLFIVGGFALILAGAAFSWAWVRNRTFRTLHLAAIAFVTAESVAGIACPLTLWEDALRHAGASGRSFIGRWLERLLYYDFSEQTFMVIYVLFAIVVALTWRLVPPRRSSRR